MLRAAIVGLGSWGQTLVNSVQGTKEIRFTVAYNRTSAKVETFCREREIRLAQSFDELLADTAVDAVVLATPHSQHEEQIKAAARAGKHVFTEKPVALERRGVEAAIRATREAGVALGVGFNRRFHPSIRELRQRVKQGQLGAIGCISAELTATTAFYRAPDSWRVDPQEEPGGAICPGMHGSPRFARYSPTRRIEHAVAPVDITVFCCAVPSKVRSLGTMRLAINDGLESVSLFTGAERRGM
jgi:predicted dehydrogenase